VVLTLADGASPADDLPTDIRRSEYDNSSIHHIIIILIIIIVVVVVVVVVVVKLQGFV